MVPDSCFFSWCKSLLALKSLVSMVFLVKRGFVGWTFETIPSFLRPFRMVVSLTPISSFAVFRIEWVGLTSNRSSRVSRNSLVNFLALPLYPGCLGLFFRSIPASNLFFTDEIVADEAPVILVISVYVTWARSKSATLCLLASCMAQKIFLDPNMILFC